MRESNHDLYAHRCIDECEGTAVAWFLMASYVYYWENDAILSDDMYDQLCSWLKANLDRLQHPHKHLVSTDMFDIGSAYGLKEHEYPLQVKSAARQLQRQLRGRR
jgi:hypothetical protein